MVVFILFMSLLLRVEFTISASNQRFLRASGLLIEDELPSLNFRANLQNLLDTLAFQASKTRFYNSSFGQASDQVHGLHLCRGDIDNQGCSDCVNYVKDAITTESHGYMEWRNSIEGVFWFDHCMVRFSNKSFTGEMGEITKEGFGVWKQIPVESADIEQVRTSNVIRFVEVLRDTLTHLPGQAANDESGKRFATKLVKVTEFESLYAMGQCTWDLSQSDCNKCLTKAVKEQLDMSYYGQPNGRALYLSCIVWYETLKSSDYLANELSSSSSVSAISS